MSTDFMSRPAATLLALTALALLLLPASRGSLRRSSATPPTEVIVGLDASLAVLPDDFLTTYLGAPVLSRSIELNAAVVSVSEDASTAIARLSVLEGVTYAEPNGRLASAATPNDPLHALQAQSFEALGLPGAWDLHTGDPSVLVAIIDSGIDLAHPDLQGAFWSNAGEIPDNGIDDDENGCIDDLNGCAFFSNGAVDSWCEPPLSQGDVQDDYGHGTFVAGIIGARLDNDTGIAGMAPGVTLMPVKILDCAGGGSVFDAAQGILYAARNGARVANLSFGMTGDSSFLAAAIRQAYYGHGMLVVAATGSTGEPFVQFPARMPEVIAVASSGSEDGVSARSPFSNWGAQVTVAAPGYGVTSTVAQGLCPEGWSCLSNAPYTTASGTSFAAPIVTALAALLLSEQPHLPPELVRGIIQATALDLPDGGEMYWDGFGRVRFYEAMHFARFYLGND